MGGSVPDGTAVRTAQLRGGAAARCGARKATSGALPKGHAGMISGSAARAQSPLPRGGEGEVWAGEWGTRPVRARASSAGHVFMRAG